MYSLIFVLSRCSTCAILVIVQPAPYMSMIITPFFSRIGLYSRCALAGLDGLLVPELNILLLTGSLICPRLSRSGVNTASRITYDKP